MIIHKNFVVWFTGLSGAGKTTLSLALGKVFAAHARELCLIDGDVVRAGLSKDLGFEDADRFENNRRVAEVGKLLADSRVCVAVALISPLREYRQFARQLIGEDRFIEVYLDCSVDSCRARDPKKLYKKALEGKIAHFTGISAAYEVPQNPDLSLPTAVLTREQCLEALLAYLEAGKYLSR